jgi:hypothetical protein
VAKLAAMEDSKTAQVVIDDASGGVLKSAAFDAIRGTNKRVVLYRDGYKWVFEGGKIDAASKDVNVKLGVYSVGGTPYGSSSSVVQVQFADNGVLPGPAEIRLKSDYLYNTYGTTGRLYLYYYDGSSLADEGGNFDLVFDGTDKWCYFTVTHNSTFVLSGKPLSLRKASVKTPVAPSKMKRGRKYRFYGYVSPRHASGTHLVTLEFYKRGASGAYVYDHSVRPKRYSATRTKSKYMVTTRISARGVWRVRAVHACGTHATSTSGWKTITVK